jgi:PKD repeat protein
MKRFLLVYVLLPFCLFSQLETSQWYFGNYAALSFSTGVPIFVNSNSVLALSSCGGASQADASGSTLFFTDGVTIWNKNNGVMQNGVVGATWNRGSSQAALVFPKSNSKYYVVLANKNGASPFLSPQFTNYALVDMAANNGLGAVISASQTVSPPGVLMSTKLAGARHCNGRDYWLLAHETHTNIVSAGTNTLGGSKNFHAYRVTSDSIYKTPVISTVGSAMLIESLSGVGNVGYGIIKFSPNGRKVCCTYPNRTVEIFDFDNSTGIVSNPIQLESISSPTLINIYGPYAFGVEFSPDGNKLYVTYLNAHPALCQYNLDAGSPAAIIASKTIIRADTLWKVDPLTNTESSSIAGLQLALDGKIYVAEPGLSSLGVISNPNALGSLCNYAPTTVQLGTVSVSAQNPIWANCNQGLPNFISNYFEQKPSIPALGASITCGAASFTSPNLSAFAGYSVTSLQWSFGDPLSGTANTSTLSNPTHQFSANGVYTVSLILNYKCGADTLKMPVSISGLPSISVTAKPKICKGENLNLQLSGASSYSLNTTALASPSTVVQPSVSSVYTITGKDNSSTCTSKKTVSVTVLACTSIAERSGDKESMVVYPNPGAGAYTIDIRKESSISVTDLSGREVYRATLQSGTHKLDLSACENGLYLLNAETLSGIQTIKLVKE